MKVSSIHVKGIVKHSTHSGEQPLPKKVLKTTFLFHNAGKEWVVCEYKFLDIYIYIHIHFKYKHALRCTCSVWTCLNVDSPGNIHKLSLRKGQTKSKPRILVISILQIQVPCRLLWSVYSGFPQVWGAKDWPPLVIVIQCHTYHSPWIQGAKRLPKTLTGSFFRVSYDLQLFRNLTSLGDLKI